MTPVFDTNVLIDYLTGRPEADQELNRYRRLSISPITWIEVMVGADTDDEARVRAFLNRFEQVPIDRKVAEAAVTIRRQYRLRVPDSIIWASARSAGTLLITRNTNDFPESEPDIRVPYRI